MTEEFTEAKNQDATSVEHDHDDFSLRTTKDHQSEQNNSRYNSISPTEREPNTGRAGRHGSHSSTGSMKLKVIFTPTAHINSNSSISGNERETDKKTEPAYTDSPAVITELLTSNDSNTEFKTESATQDTVNYVDQVTVQAHLKDSTKRGVNTTASDVLAVTTQVEDIGSKAEPTMDQPDSKKTTSEELHDNSSISSNDDDDGMLKDPIRGQLLIIHSTEEDPNDNVDIPITINNSTAGNDIDEDTENQIINPNENFSEQKMPTSSDEASENVMANIEGTEPKNLSSTSSDESDEPPLTRKRVDTVSFKVEATTKSLVREASLEMEPIEVVVVSSCSTSPISELLEDSEDKVIVNPETDEASYGTLSRRRAKSGIDAVILKSANSARRSVKVNTNVEVITLDDATGDENLSPVPRVSTLNRFRNTFSWKRGRSLVKQSFADTRQDHFLSFHNISYAVPQKKFFRTIGTKVILKNLSGIMRTGINAIMGPSGSGKTSLLDIISGRKVKGGVTGDVVINNEFIPENFRCASGYVTQEETVTGTLTVLENIMFSAQLRLPRDMTYDEKIEIVEEVIKDLGLKHCADSRVGTDKQRGVSGGERKRTAIGMELIVSPGVLFLDEPTSGLDSTTATSVMDILHNLSLQGRVIILSIHQPRYSILKLFDNMTLLSRGEMIYHGSVRSALPFFTDVLGVGYEKHNNPADFFIDVIIKNESIMDGISASEEDMTQIKKIEAGNAVNEYAKGYRKSGEYKSLKQELSPILEKAKRNPIGWTPNYANRLFWQVWHLSIRTFKTIVRDLNGAFTTIMAIIVLAVFSGVIFFQLDTTLQGQRDRVGAMFFNMLCNILPGLAGMEALAAERALFVHENANGFYNTGAYFLAKIIMDIIPFRILTVFLYCPIAYFITGLRSGADRFFFYMLTMVVLSFAAASQVFTFSAVIGVYKVANPLLLMVIAISMVFSGFFITLGNIRVWLRWLQYLSIYRYAFHAFMWNEFDGTVFCNTNTDPLPFNVSGVVEAFNCQQSISADLNCDLNFTLCGDVLLSHYQFDAFNAWWNIIILTAVAVTTLIIGFIGLLCVTKRK